MSTAGKLLVFNLMTDADDPILGFTTVWLNALAARFEHVDVITMQAGRLALAANVRVYSVGKEKGYSEPRRALEFYRILFGLLRQNHYAACFAHMMPLFALMGAPLLKLAHLRTTLWYAHRATGRIVRGAEKTVDAVVTASPESFRLPSHKVQVIGHGVDTEHFKPADSPLAAEGTFTIITAGRIAPVKGLEILLEAVKRVADERGTAAIRLRIVGSVSPMDEAYAARLREWVAQHGLADTILFPGALTYADMPGAYQQADAMVNVSRTGSIDKAVLEAMACGLPVITANEAFHTLLAPWADTLLTPPDDPAELAARLQGLAALSPAERSALGVQLRALVVARHSLNHLIERLMGILVSGG